MARRRGGGGGGGGDELRWLGTYGDAVTLLLAFFVMLYAMSQVDSTKFQLLVSGLGDPFKNKTVIEGILEGGTGIVGQSYPSEPSSGIEGIEINLGEAVPTPPDERMEQEPEEGEYLVTQSDLLEVRDALAGVVEEYGLTASIGMEVDIRGLVVSIATDDVLFASGSPVINEKGKDLIAAIAPILDEFSNPIRVEGHTDTVPLNQNGYTNWNLSADRALAVLALLQDIHGLNPTRLSATGYGEYQPIASNASEDGRRQNRRVVLVIEAGGPATRGTPSQQPAAQVGS